MVDQLEHVLHAVDHLLGEADDHHLLLAVLEHAQLGLAGEQVEDLGNNCDGPVPRFRK